jgi:sensor c-di-GMP phosphodiesterase-like protein
VITLDAIREGLSRGEFFLEYLPVVELDGGRCVGAEALIRWRRPGGVVPPQEFIPLADNTPLSGAITYWVMETAAAEVGDWLRSSEDVHLGINIPPEILGRGGLEYVAVKAGLKDVAHKIILEVTERGVPDLLGTMALTTAARHGVRIALDDVAVDGANLIVLARCHVSIIKLDHTLIAGLKPSDGQPAWLAGLSAMLRSTELEVIAEGVETEWQRDALRAAGIKLAQGYLFSLPLRAEAFLAYFRATRAGA